LIAFDVCAVEEFKMMKRICSKLNAVLKSFFERRNSILTEVSCNFGKCDDKIFIVGDFTPKSLKISSENINPYDLQTTSKFKKYIDNFLGIIK